MSILIINVRKDLLDQIDFLFITDLLIVLLNDHHEQLQNVAFHFRSILIIINAIDEVLFIINLV